MRYYACSWDVRGDLTLNSMAQIHTSVTLLTSRDLTWSSGWLTRQHASHISVVAHIWWGVINVSSAQEHSTRLSDVVLWTLFITVIHTFTSKLDFLKKILCAFYKLPGLLYEGKREVLHETISICPTVRNLVTNPLFVFSWNSVEKFFMKSCRGIVYFAKNDSRCQSFYLYFPHVLTDFSEIRCRSPHNVVEQSRISWRSDYLAHFSLGTTVLKKKMLLSFMKIGTERHYLPYRQKWNHNYSRTVKPSYILKVKNALRPSLFWNVT
jgi:hypothetical protein